MERYRDPIHGFIEVREGENKIINSPPFLRLRNIRQLGMTYYVYHGAEHTRFGHSVGTMHVVTKAFRSALSKGTFRISEKKKVWYEQILRLIALTHDLGHAPFSHASEAVFRSGLTHEAYTEKIMKESCIGEYINEIGREFVAQYGEAYNITPDLVCDIYAGRCPGSHNEFTFLLSFMDSELDCDKMDYLLRDSYYCGVNYGRFDLERLIACLTVYMRDGAPHLAIEAGGIQAFEEFVLARYFMFIEVYFHRTRRYLDIMLGQALRAVLPRGCYPEEIQQYLAWDDCRVLQKLTAKKDTDEACGNIIYRRIYTRVLDTPTQPIDQDLQIYELLKEDVLEKYKKENFIEDSSAQKMPHKIPTKTSLEDEKAIVIYDKKTGKLTTISAESHVIRSLTDKINIIRLYVKPELKNEVISFVRELNKKRC